MIWLPRWWFYCGEFGAQLLLLRHCRSQLIAQGLLVCLQRVELYRLRLQSGGRAFEIICALGFFLLEGAGLLNKPLVFRVQRGYPALKLCDGFIQR